MTTLRVYCAIADKARRAVSAGHSAIVDAVFAQGGRARQAAEHAAASLRRAAYRPVPHRRSRFADPPRSAVRSRDASEADATVARYTGRPTISAT